MNKKTLRAILIALGLLITGFAAVLIVRATENDPIVVCTPATVYNELDESAAAEVIPDEITPLAGPQENAPELIVVTAAVRAAAPANPAAPAVIPPAAEEPAQQEPVQQEPAPEEPAQEEPAPEEPAPEEPAQEEPAPEEPIVESTAATRLLERAATLISQFHGCTTSAEKRALLGVANSNFSNDSFRAKLVSDMGGIWEQLEEEVVDATAYQQSKTLYVQVFIAGKPAAYEAVVYSTQNPALSGNQWSTNLVYNDETATWMEYTKKHPYNDSREGYKINGLYNNDDGWDALKETMDESDDWQPVEITAEDETPADETPAVGTEG